MALIKIFSRHLKGMIISEDVDLDKLGHYHHTKTCSVVTHILKKKKSLDSVSLPLPLQYSVTLQRQMTQKMPKPIRFHSSSPLPTQYSPTSIVASTMSLTTSPKIYI